MTQQETTQAVERAHAELGGSSAERWMHCPGSYYLYKQLRGEPELHPNTIRGTKAHGVAESHLKAFLEVKIHGTATTKITAADDDPELTEWAVEYVKNVWENVLEFSITGKAFGVEDEFTISQDLSMWGFVDFWCVYVDDRGKRVGVILDFKTGHHAVDVKGNAQLAFYAVALRAWVRSQGKDLDYVRIAVHQVTSDPKYKEDKITAKQLDAWEKKFYKAAKTIFVDKKATFKCGDYCEFCRAKGICKKYLSKVEGDTKLIISAATPMSGVVVEQLSDEQLRAIALNKEFVLSICKAVDAQIIARHLAGNPVEGTKVIRGAGKRCWKEMPEEVLINSLTALGIEEPYVKKVITISKAEAAMGAAKLDLAPLLDRTEGSLSIVPDSDFRPAAGSDMALLD